VSFPRRRVYTVPLPDREPLVLGERPLVMGILNVTPDSFAERARLVDPEAAVTAAEEMEACGADLIDIGGESTRPGAVPVSTDDELARVVPVLKALRSRVRVPLSIDTTKAAVARAALAEGAAIVNDISGLRHDPALARVVADAGAALVLMHMRGRPDTMYEEAVYADLLREVIAEVGASVGAAIEAGVSRERIMVDPGIGFAKRPPHSYGVLARLPEFAAALDRPVLVGVSRKSYLRDATGGRPAADRDWGTAAAVTAAVLAGAHIVRVHSVSAMAQVVRTAEEIRNASGHSA
jgi:dihydropteroate synthase